MKTYLILILILSIGFSGCQERNNQPKPKGFLALNYQPAEYKNFRSDCPFSFQLNKAIKKQQVKQNSCDYTITYPDKKANIYLTYRPIKDNLQNLLIDAQKIPTKHQIKADAISVEVFENQTRRVFGNFYKVKGNAASQAQFYVTDSINHFLTASLYFDAKPNYDSVYPASQYIIRDMKEMMETMKWKRVAQDSLSFVSE